MLIGSIYGLSQNLKIILKPQDVEEIQVTFEVDRKSAENFVAANYYTSFVTLFTSLIGRKVNGILGNMEVDQNSSLDLNYLKPFFYFRIIKLHQLEILLLTC